jgi:hypothetical protein
MRKSFSHEVMEIVCMRLQPAYGRLAIFESRSGGAAELNELADQGKINRTKVKERKPPLRVYRISLCADLSHKACCHFHFQS